MHDLAAEAPGPPVAMPRRLDMPRLLRAIAVVAILGGILTIVSIVIPHPDHTYDRQYIAVGVALLLGGAFVLMWSRSRDVSERAVHVATALLSVVVLTLAWFGMRDLGGVQAVFLILLLGISASIGPAWWSAAFLLLQSAGYGLVLATSDDVLRFDRAGQWLVVTMGLLTCLAYNGMLRRALLASADRDAQRRAERDRERELHAERLEHLNAELQQTSDLKSRFVAMASHELRTPLTAIEGFAGTLQHRWDDLSDADKRTFVDVIDAQAQRLGRLVADLLTLSRIESGRLQAHLQDVSLRTIVERTLRDLGDMDVSFDCDESIRVHADPDHVQQVLLNFLTNARAYGEPPVTIAATIDGAWVELVINDDGLGVDPEFVPQLFDRFARAPVAERHDGSSGTGLGLSIVEGLAEANGGHAWYRPNEPRGASFGVRLPRATSDTTQD
ncbi:MAG: multi-sensor hybrid histidine kinase [Thermoleophilia bacterium]|nr:multi-sensor hybrid histidine kinase [Thermoleophilia bacterium]